VVAVLSKARKLSTLRLDKESKATAAELMKHANDSQKRLQALGRASQTNGKGLDKATLDRSLDDLIQTFEDMNKKLDDLLAKAKA
jgi:hypothetical protein